MSDSATPWTAARQAFLSITNSWNLLKLMPIELVMPSNHLILCCLFLLLPSIFPSIRVFSNKSALCMRWPKYWSFSFNISPSKEHPGLISFRMDRLDLLAVQGTLKSLLQHHSSKASIVWHSALFTAQLSHPYMTTGNTIALTRWTFVGTVNTSVEVNDNSNNNSNTGIAIFVQIWARHLCEEQPPKQTTIRRSSEVLKYSLCVIFEESWSIVESPLPCFCSGSRAGCISQPSMSADFPVDSASGKCPLES